MINRYRFPVKTFSICLILLSTVIQSLSWAFWRTGLGIITSTYLSWGLAIIIIVILINYWKHSQTKIQRTANKIYVLWLAISILGFIRGIFMIDNYWTAKSLIQSTFDLSLPLMALAFSSKNINSYFIKRWMIIATPLFLITMIIGGAQGASHFSYSIFLFIVFFISILPKKWAIFTGFITLYMLSFYITDRAQGLKALASIGIAIIWICRNKISTTLIQIANWGIWITTIILIVLFVTGTYNIFAESSQKDKGKYVTEVRRADGSIGIEDASADTRTAIYESVIKSAVKNDYVWFGRTPARGNDGSYFGDAIAQITGKSERLKNEVCFPNLFTWLGMVGMIAYILFYFQASRLALYKSKSRTMKILACFISFHFLLGWMEDINRWDNNNVLIWMVIGMCFSNEFRNMSDTDFKRWILSCLPKKILGLKI